MSSPFLPELQTERLILRPFRAGDLMDLYDYAKDPDVGPNAGWPPHVTLEDSRTVLSSFIEKGEVFAIVLKETGKVIGSVGLHQDKKRETRDTRMLGYAMGKPWWGRGYMTEAAGRVLRYAFEGMGMARVSIYHYPFNLRSKRVIEKLGFVFEGTLRGASVLPGGIVTDDVCYLITREEYESARR